jgi:hypothetical protein
MHTFKISRSSSSCTVLSTSSFINTYCSVRHTVRTPQQLVKHAQCPKARMGVSLTRFKLHWQALLDAIPRYLLGFFASLGFCSPAPATSPAPDIVSTINHRLKKSPYLSSRRFFPLAFSYWDDTTPRCVESAHSC